MPAARLAADVRIRDLTKHYGRLEALRGISFEVAPGEIFGLLGPNGAGKTTALECLLGLRRPDSGSLHVAGLDALAAPAAVRRIVGAQLQAAALQDKITPRQALQLAAAFYADSVPVDELLDRFGLLPKAGASFDTLSGGQQQRVLLALAFIHRPRLVVLDEPTAGLDPQSRRELHEILRQLRSDGCTILLSTHHLDEAGQLCDRIGILHEGRIVAEAPPAQLVAGARTHPRISFRTAQPLDATVVSSLREVISTEERSRVWSVSTRDVSGTITALAAQLEREDNALLDLQIQRPTLEDVFLELTGRAWSPADESPGAAMPDRRNER